MGLKKEKHPEVSCEIRLISFNSVINNMTELTGTSVFIVSMCNIL